MCGICGVFNPGQEIPASPVGKMVTVLDHRGPDARGTRSLPGAVLGHTRLSIIDLRTGDQPMPGADGRLWISFNGEIYNFRQVREILRRDGFTFHTQSDTEVVLASYERWGAGCLQHFRGMFSFVIWDTRSQSLFAARDPFGEKPLYYVRTADGSLAAASEIQALVCAELIAPRLDHAALDAFLELGYIPPDRTVYGNIQTLPPGHYLEWSGGETRLTRYWRPHLDNTAISLEEAGGRLHELMTQAVERQMLADVPVGAFLSGGLDSSTIVALMQGISAEPVKTFSAGFGEAINELPFAREVAARYATGHSEIDLGAPPVSEMLPRMCQVFDEPFADSSHIPTYLLAAFAREQVKVALSGDGGDELFGGYSRYVPLALSEKMKPSLFKWLSLRAATRLAGHRYGWLRTSSEAWGLATRAPDMWERARIGDTVFKLGQRLQLWGERAKEIDLWCPGPYFYPPETTSGLDRAFYFDLTCYLPGDILVKVDRCAMAHGLETRTPFLDRDLVEFCLSLPSSLKVQGTETKILLRHTFETYWPESIRRRGKQGFGAPYRHWLRAPGVQSLLKRVLAPNSALNCLLPGIQTRRYQPSGYQAWVLLSLGLWLERHAGSFA